MAAGQDDRFPGSEASVLAPASRWVAITPGAGLLAEIPKFIHNAGTSGTVAVEGADGVSATFYMAQGATLMIRPRKITAAAGTIIACY